MSFAFLTFVSTHKILLSMFGITIFAGSVLAVAVKGLTR